MNPGTAAFAAAIVSLKCQLREHIATYWTTKKPQPDDRIKLRLPRWAWDALLTDSPPVEQADVVRLAQWALGQSDYLVPSVQWGEAEAVAVRVLTQLGELPDKDPTAPRLR